MVTTLAWPFFGLEDESGCRLPYVGMQGPIRTPDAADVLDDISQSATLIGFTSYLTFPAGRHRGDDRDYGSLCRAWCHCFRDPYLFVPDDRPAALIAFSDFVDFRVARPEWLFARDETTKAWDFAYVCPEGVWKEYCKNWDLARRCLPVLCRDLGLEGILVGRSQIGDLPDCGGRLMIRGEIPWRELMAVFTRSRFVFVPNRVDPSPRVIAEALCMNTPVLVNHRILGGWHYVNPFTGFFFEDEHDVGTAALRCLREWTSPRRWFVAHHGPLLAGERLKRFIGQFDPSMRRVSQIRIVGQPFGPRAEPSTAAR